MFWLLAWPSRVEKRPMVPPANPDHVEGFTVVGVVHLRLPALANEAWLFDQLASLERGGGFHSSGLGGHGGASHRGLDKSTT
jgi:hypothetical protein